VIVVANVIPQINPSDIQLEKVTHRNLKVKVSLFKVKILHNKI